MMPNHPYNNGPPAPMMHHGRRQNQHEYYNYYPQQPQYHPQHAAAYPQQWYPQYPMHPQYPRPYHPMAPQHPMQHSPMIVSSTPQPPVVTPQMRQPMVSQPESTPPTYPLNASPAPSSIQQPPTPVVSSGAEVPASPSPQSFTQQPALSEQILVSGRRTPWYPQLPWYSNPDSVFPPKAPRRKRRTKHYLSNETLQFPIREENEVREENSSISAINGSEASIQADSSSFDLDSLKPSEAETSQTTPLPTETPDQSPRSDKQTPSKGVRPVVPAVPVAPRPTSSSTGAQASQPGVPNVVISGLDDNAAEDETLIPDKEEASASVEKVTPKSWADLVRSKAAQVSPTQSSNGSTAPPAMVVGSAKSSHLAEVLRAFTVNSGAKISFLEPRGLVNTGNMCYMNSVLQVLLYCIPFYEFLDLVGKRASHSFQSDTPLLDAMVMFMREFPVIDSAESVEKLRMRLKDHELEQYGEAFIPEHVYDAIKRIPRFSNMRRGHQQDAEEFLGILLEVLHEESDSVMSKAPADQDQASPVSERSASVDSGWLEVGPKQKPAITRSSGHPTGDSPISKIFGGKLRSELRVLGMKNSVTLEAYRPLQLDIGASNVHNIVDALKGLTKTETLQGDFQSPRGPGIPAHKQVFIETLPPVLILHLKRFQYDNTGGAQKIWKKVGYPLELEIPKEVFPQQKRAALLLAGLPKYRLSAVVYHHGNNASGGHYTVDVRRQDGFEWIRLNDTIIRRLRAEDVAEAGAEEDPRVLAKALEQHKRDVSTGRSSNPYEHIDGADEGEQEKGWKQVNGSSAKESVQPTTSTTARKWNAVVNGATSPSSAGLSTPKKDAFKENKVAYLLFYRKVE